jgi:hypothetical protein
MNAFSICLLNTVMPKTGEAVMEKVKLNREDLEIVLETFQMIVDWKHRWLERQNWAEFKSNWLPKFIDYAEANEWPVHQTNKNVFVWMESQLKYSKRLVPKQRPRDAQPLSELQLGKEFLDICKHAALGQEHYNRTRATPTEFNNLFS